MCFPRASVARASSKMKLRDLEAIEPQVAKRGPGATENGEN